MMSAAAPGAEDSAVGEPKAQRAGPPVILWTACGSVSKPRSRV